MIRLTLDQRTDAWRLARCGRLTSSRAADMCATRKDGSEAAGRKHLRTQLVLERLTGVPQERDDFQSPAMLSGIAREADALAAYEAETGALVRPGGFVAHDTLLAGCSPDGDVGDFTGLVEVKCRQSANHLEYLKTGSISRDHLLQITHQLWITGAAWVDYVSFDDRFPPALQLRIVRIARTDVDLRLYELNVRAFLAEVDAELAAVTQLVEDDDEDVA